MYSYSKVNNKISFNKDSECWYYSLVIFDPHTETNLLPLHGYSHVVPQIGYSRPSPSIKKGASSLQICNHITTKHIMLNVLN